MAQHYNSSTKRHQQKQRNESGRTKRQQRSYERNEQHRARLATNAALATEPVISHIRLEAECFSQVFFTERLSDGRSIGGLSNKYLKHRFSQHQRAERRARCVSGHGIPEGLRVR